MITAFFPTIILFILYVCCLLVTKRYRNYSTSELISLTLFVCYMIALIGVVFFPFPIQKELIEDCIKYGMGYNHNFIPFYTIIRSCGEMNEIGFFSILHLLLNIVLFIPFGLLIPFIRNKKIILKSILWDGFLTSLGIEIIQFLLGLLLGYAYRSADIDDLILNTIGTFIGYLLFKIIYKRQKNR